MNFINLFKKIIRHLIWRFNKILDSTVNSIVKSSYYHSIKKYSGYKKVIIFLTPEHYNLGDHAIAFAEWVCLKDIIGELPIVEFSYEDVKYRFNSIKRIVNKDDIIIFHGGGNFGDLYEYEEKERIKILKKFSNNKIVIMPQSINYSDSERGQKCLKRAKKVLERCRTLHILCRDNYSYDFAKGNFTNDIVLCPDIVHYLQNYFDKFFINDKRENILLLFRNDKEKVLDSELIEDLKGYFNQHNLDYKATDTLADFTSIMETRERSLKYILSEYYKAKLVITDRFHGMVFSVITCTPCIVFKSVDHKIEAGAKWYPEYSNINYMNGNNASDIHNAIEDILSNENKTFANKKELVFETLNKILKGRG